MNGPSTMQRADHGPHLGHERHRLFVYLRHGLDQRHHDADRKPGQQGRAAEFQHHHQRLAQQCANVALLHVVTLFWDPVSVPSPPALAGERGKQGSGCHFWNVSFYIGIFMMS